MTLNGCQNGVGIDVEQVRDKAVGTLRRDCVTDQAADGKVPQVGGHDHIRLAVDRGGEDMAVVGVGKVQFGSQMFEPGHQGIREVPVHDRPGSVQYGRVDIGPVGQKVAGPLRVDVAVPQRCKQIAVRKAQQQVAKARGVENIGVQQRRQAIHCLLQAEFLVASGQFIKRFAAAGFRLAPVSKDILQADATV